MTLKEGEDLFGKRWGEWSDLEQQIFVSELKGPEDLTGAVICNLVVKHLDCARKEIVTFVTRAMTRQ